MKSKMRLTILVLDLLFLSVGIPIVGGGLLGYYIWHNGIGIGTVLIGIWLIVCEIILVNLLHHFSKELQ